MNIFRGLAIFLPQVTLLCFEAGSRDLLFGFNQTDAGFSTLISLLALTPLLTFAWLIAEMTRAVRSFRRQRRDLALLMPAVALFVFAEAIIIDLYILSHARM